MKKHRTPLGASLRPTFSYVGTDKFALMEYQISKGKFREDLSLMMKEYVNAGGKIRKVRAGKKESE